MSIELLLGMGIGYLIACLVLLVGMSIWGLLDR